MNGVVATTILGLGLEECVGSSEGEEEFLGNQVESVSEWLYDTTRIVICFARLQISARKQQ